MIRMVIKTTIKKEDTDLFKNTLNAEAGRFLHYDNSRMYYILLRAQAIITELENQLKAQGSTFSEQKEEVEEPEELDGPEGLLPDPEKGLDKYGRPLPSPDTPMKPDFGACFHGECWYTCPRCGGAFEFYQTVHEHGFTHLQDNLYKHIKCGQVIEMR